MWTADNVDILKNGIDNNMSFAEIAKLIGKTRNSVAGKKSRMGLCKREQFVRNTRKRQAVNIVIEPPEGVINSSLIV